MIIPSIDLMNGKVVQLKQGKEKVLETENPIRLAKKFSKYGEISVIDLDAAFERGDNYEIIKKICSIADCRVGGGVRSIEKANRFLRMGAKKIIIGTKADTGFLKKLPKSRLIVSVDSKNGFVMNKGWTQKTNKTTEEVMTGLEDYCSEFLFTDIEREGKMTGVDIRKIKNLNKISENKLTVAGGIKNVKEINLLENLNINSQLGMSLYTENINLREAFTSILDFKKCNGLIPTIVQDTKNQVLMLAYSSKRSLRKTLRTGVATYYSRSKDGLWTKGEESGNYQKLERTRWDCDRDALLFTVKQKGNACHTGSYSCFNEKEFEFKDLYEIISKRKDVKINNSYTSKLLKNENLIKGKIEEECKEVVNYNDRENLIWEISDLVYFVLVLMARNKINIQDIKSELWRRRK